MLKYSGLVFILVCCIGNGFVRDGITTWAPTIIDGLSGSETLNPTLTSLLIPVLNLMGVLLAKKVYRLFGGDARRSVGYLMLTSAALALLLIPAMKSAIVCALLLGLCCSATYGINPMLTTFIPMGYEQGRRVSLVAGMMDSFIYVGSSLAGVITGAIRDSAGWTPVFILWCGVAVMAFILALASTRGAKWLAQWKG